MNRGGHAYGAVYSGPIGAVITPLMKGLHNYPDLPHASSLCGACFEACPVHIDIPRQLINLRRDMVTNRTMPLSGRLAYKLWAIVLKRPLLYRLASRIMALILRRMAQSNESRWINKGPGPLGAWTAERDFPSPSSNSFRDWWNRQKGGQER